MSAPPSPPTSGISEAERLTVLDSYAIMDTGPEPAFDDIAALASDICGTPIAVVNLIGDRRQWFKAEIGLGVRETPIETSFCAHALLERDFLLVPDATLDRRFDCNPLVTAAGGLRFYAGALLKTGDGVPLGTLCVLDTRPRTLEQRQIDALKRLAAQVMSQLELGRALRDQQAADRLHRTLFNSIDAGFCIIEVLFEPDGRPCDYRFIETNPAFEAQTGLADVTGLTIRSLVPEQEQHWFDTYGEVALTGRSLRFENHAAGLGDRHYEVHAFRVGEPEDRQVAVLFTDISDRRRAEIALQTLNATLEKRIADAIADRDSAWTLSQDLLGVAADGRFVSTNPAWTTLLGWSEAEVRETPFMDLVHPDDRAATFAILEHLAGGHRIQRFENRYRAKDGQYRWLSWTATPDKGLVYTVARDITEEKERAAALKAAEEALRQAQKMEAVGQLTGGVAHDFNNLLTIIRSSSELLQRPGLSDERRKRYTDAIAETVDRAAKLTGQLLAFARRQVLTPEIFDAVDRIAAVADMLDTVLGSRIAVATEIACRPCLIEADSSQFETALINMAVNARDAMDGEGKLTIRVDGVTGMPAIRGHAASGGAFVVVSLTDTGSGIAADQIEKIFEPFFTTKEVGKGTGLGLSQVFGFAKQSGGDVGVRSTPGVGTTFSLYLPRADAAAISTEPTAPLAVIGDHLHGRRLLVVEDNAQVGAFSTQLLQDLGYTTVWAANAAEALALLAEDASFDAVFTDVVMPGMSGIELGREVRRCYPDVPVILTSGYSHVLAEEGAHGFRLLRKPYSAEELSRALRSAMAADVAPGA